MRRSIANPIIRTLCYDFTTELRLTSAIETGHLLTSKLKVPEAHCSYGLKKNFVETYKASQTFKAPLDFVFQWCTDFREDDGKMVGSKAKKTFLEKTAKRVVWVAEYKEDGKPREGVRVVWLRPPNTWKLDTCGDHREIGEYVLSPKGKDKTRLDMKFKISYDSKDDAPDKKKWEKEVAEEWQTFADYLQKDYKGSLHVAKE